VFDAAQVEDQLVTRGRRLTAQRAAVLRAAAGLRGSLARTSGWHVAASPEVGIAGLPDARSTVQIAVERVAARRPSCSGDSITLCLPRLRCDLGTARSGLPESACRCCPQDGVPRRRTPASGRRRVPRVCGKPVMSRCRGERPAVLRRPVPLALFAAVLGLVCQGRESERKPGAGLRWWRRPRSCRSCSAGGGAASGRGLVHRRTRTGQPTPPDGGPDEGRPAHHQWRGLEIALVATVESKDIRIG
jgi:hypothetical protein